LVAIKIFVFQKKREAGWINNGPLFQLAIFQVRVLKLMHLKVFMVTAKYFKIFDQNLEACLLFKHFTLIVLWVGFSYFRLQTFSIIVDL
jgi:hypothetical protein